MRALTLTLVAAALLLGSLPAQEPIEPGVFLYSYDDVNEVVVRNYYTTQADAQEALRPAREAAITAVTNLKAQIGNNSINVDAAADWMIFCEQWELYQRWVADEYDLSEELLDDPDASNARFAAVPGVPLAQIADQAEEDLQQAVADAAAQVNVPAYAEGLGGEFAGTGPVGFGTGQVESVLQGAGVDVPQADITLANFAYQGQSGPPADEQWQRTVIESVQENIAQLVDEKAQRHKDDLVDILDTIEIEQDRREQRQAAIAARQRDIHNLREEILDREQATEVRIDGRTYLFSEQPLRQHSGDAINITTPNLTPYDMFNRDGTARAE